MLPHSGVSGIHARIQLCGNKYFIFDQHSRNGVLVIRSNSESTTFREVEKITKTRINDKDIILIGPYSLHIGLCVRISSNGDSEAQWTETGNTSSLPAHELFNSHMQPTSGSLRKLIDRILPIDSDIACFCIDHFPDIERRFSDGMDRVQKLNLLIKLANHREIVRYIRLDFPDKFKTYGNVLKYTE